MTTQHDLSEPRFYPKKHLIAASGIAAVVSLALLVYPSQKVEAKKTFLDLPTEQVNRQAPLKAHATPVDQSVKTITTDSQLPSLDPQLSSLTAEEPSSADTPQPQSLTVQVKNGDTLSTLFEEVGLGHSMLMNMLDQDKNAKRFTQLRVDQELQFDFDADGKLSHLSSQLSALKSIHLKLDADTDQFVFEEQIQETTIEDAYASGEITGSLLGATTAAGLPYKLALDMANVFAYDIDFARDLREGDRFEVVYEQQKLDDQTVGTGRVLAARFINKGKTYTAIRYTNKQGQTAYYNSDGSSNQRAFIRTPVDFSRISSRFNPGRKHPILNKIRAHKGVDYAAPTGTPIKATGNGKISFVGTKGGYGKTIVIQHGRTYRTLYGHMNGYAKGMRNGASVKQGQIIGYVGMTGLATGPHLHYEFHVNGQHVDPLSHSLPTADPISKTEMAAFNQLAKPYLAMMDEQQGIQLASATETDADSPVN